MHSRSSYASARGVAAVAGPAALIASIALIAPAGALADSPFVETLQPKTQHAASDLHPLQLEVISSVRPTVGRFDAYGVYAENPPGMSAWSVTSLLSAAYRFNRYFELYGRTAVGHSWTSSATGFQASDVIGYPALETRFHLPPSLSVLRMHWIVYAGYTLPFLYSSRRTTGEPMRDVDTDELGGDGGFIGEAWTLGLSVSHTFGSLRAAFGFSTSFPLSQSVDLPDAPRGTPAVLLQRGEQLQAKEGFSWVFNPTWSVGGAFRQEWGLESNVDGSVIGGTATRRFSSIVAASYSPSPEWRWGASMESPFPFYAYMLNRTNAPTVSATLTYLGL